MSETCDRRFFTVLDEAKAIFEKKSEEAEELKKENDLLKQSKGQLETDKIELALKQESLIEKMKILEERLNKSNNHLQKLKNQLKNSKVFIKNFLKDLINRMIEIEKNGIYNAEAFSYLVGDVGRSLMNASFGEKRDKSPEKRQSACKLSTNKEKKRSRFESSRQIDLSGKTRTRKDVDDFDGREPPKTSRKDCGGQSQSIPAEISISDNSVNIIDVAENSVLVHGSRGKVLQDIQPKKVNPVFNTVPRSSGKASKLENASTKIPKESNVDHNTSASEKQPRYKSIRKCEPLRQIPQETPAVNIRCNHKQNSLDHDLTLRSPIGPPTRTSTPQGPLSGERAKKIEDLSVTMGFFKKSSSFYVDRNSLDGLKCTLLPRMVSDEGRIPPVPEEKSPTIPSRSYSMLSEKNDDDTCEEWETKRKRNFDTTFGSLLDDPRTTDRNAGSARPVQSKSGMDCDALKLGTAPRKNGDAKDEPSAAGQTPSPVIIDLDDSGFLKPNAANLPRKRLKTTTVHETSQDASSIMFLSYCGASPPVQSSKVFGRGDESVKETGKTDIGKETGESDESKLPFRLNLNETTVEEKPSERPDDKSVFKYNEVVRGRDKREKLNGYFCSDCQKYYGGLELTEQEIQERLQACSRHRARFSPPPGTPDHFWEVDFMNTHEYVERGFMRTESELPPQRKKLRKRKPKEKLSKK